MLPLDSPRWCELSHAYGSAQDIPQLLRGLESLPGAEGDEEPWFSLWSALAHQGDVYSASFAAVPHVIHALASGPAGAHFTYFQFPAWVEVCRQRQGITIPSDLAQSYKAALAQLPSLVAAAAVREWDEGFLCCALAAVAAAKGEGIVAEAALELLPDVAGKFMAWFHEQ